MKPATPGASPTPPAAATWVGQVRAPFLVLSILLVLVGGAVAMVDGHFDLLRFVLCAVGVTLAHVAVNLYNELSDHETGIDDLTRRTPFSGGSGSLQSGATTPGAVRLVAAGSLAGAGLIGLYLAWVAGWLLLLLVAAGAVASRFYTTHLARVMMGEAAAGLALGTFVVLGTYYAMASTLTLEVVWVSVPPGILTSLLLLLNEFPDREADRAGGRRHLVIILGVRGAAWVYTAGLAATYLWVVAGVVAGILPATTLLALLTLPLAAMAAWTALRRGEDHEAMVPALGANVGVVLGTDLMLATGYLVLGLGLGG